MLRLIAPLAAALLACAPAFATPVNPLDSGEWFQIARMADDNTGAFDGDGNLQNTYSFGTYTSGPQAEDFARPFDVYTGMNILFTTGDREVWGMTSYATLRAVMDAPGFSFNPNISFESHLGTVMGNVLSRPQNFEDPWISLVGTHFDGIANGLIIWGENDWGGPNVGHNTLQMARGGIDVFVTVAPSTVPLPAGLVLLASGLMAAGVAQRRRRT